MFKEGQVLKLKADCAEEGLPSEITVVRVDGAAVFVTSKEDGAYESTNEILEEYYDAPEEFTVESMPKLTIHGIEEAIALFDIYAQTQNPAAGMQVKSKLLSLKDKIAKATGQVTVSKSLLGKKLA